jgi:hypothetical protein
MTVFIHRWRKLTRKKKISLAPKTLESLARSHLINLKQVSLTEMQMMKKLTQNMTNEILSVITNLEAKTAISKSCKA